MACRARKRSESVNNVQSRDLSKLSLEEMTPKEKLIVLPVLICEAARVENLIKKYLMENGINGNNGILERISEQSS